MPTLNLSVLYFPGFDSCLDQPNRRIRTRMYGGVGGGSCKAPPYPEGQTRGSQVHTFMEAGSQLWRLSDLCDYPMTFF